MALTQLTKTLNYISALDNTPGLQPEQLKEKFDQAAGEIKTYINGTLIRDLESYNLSTSFLVNNLTSGGTTKALTAEMGKQLNTAVQAIPVVVNDLSTGGTTKALSAEQGKVLNTALAGKQKTITSGTAAPSGGANGDIYLRY